MFRTLVISLMFVPLAAAVPVPSPVPPSSSSEVAASPMPSPLPNDADATAELFALVNQSRSEAGLPALKMDEGMNRAALQHAAAMAQQQDLSHQFSGEPSLSQRLASNATLQMDGAGENVAMTTGDVEEAHDNLMHSPVHHDNLLNSKYDVAGFAVVHSNNRIWVVQDFGRSVPSYSAQQAEDVVISAFNEQRRQNNLPTVSAHIDAGLRNAACAMSQAHQLNTQSLHGLGEGRYFLSFTNTRPQILPVNSGKAAADASIHGVSVGVCYSSSSAVPAGVYWVAAIFY